MGARRILEHSARHVYLRSLVRALVALMGGGCVGAAREGYKDLTVRTSSMGLSCDLVIRMLAFQCAGLSGLVAGAHDAGRLIEIDEKYHEGMVVRKVG